MEVILAAQSHQSPGRILPTSRARQVVVARPAAPGKKLPKREKGFQLSAIGLRMMRISRPWTLTSRLSCRTALQIGHSRSATVEERCSSWKGSEGDLGHNTHTSNHAVVHLKLQPYLIHFGLFCFLVWAAEAPDLGTDSDTRYPTDSHDRMIAILRSTLPLMTLFPAFAHTLCWPGFACTIQIHNAWSGCEVDITWCGFGWDYFPDVLYLFVRWKTVADYDVSSRSCQFSIEMKEDRVNGLHYFVSALTVGDHFSSSHLSIPTVSSIK